MFTQSNEIGMATIPKILSYEVIRVTEYLFIESYIFCIICQQFQQKLNSLSMKICHKSDKGVAKTISVIKDIHYDLILNFMNYLST